MALPPIAPPAAAPVQRSGLALASLILGICGIVLCLGPLAGVPAVICGHMAHSRIKRSGGFLTGQGLATGGLVTGYISIAMIFVLGMLASIAIPNFIVARKAAQKAGCISNLNAIEGAKQVWAHDFNKAATALPTDSDLFGSDKPLREKPSCPAGGTYSLNPVGKPATCTIPGHELAEPGH